MTMRSITNKPNVLLIMTDQQRFDTIHALGNEAIHTPNLDRLVTRGVAFTNAYSTSPVCVPARYTLRTGCEPYHTGVYANEGGRSLHAEVRAACGPYLPEVMTQRGYRTFGVGKFHTSPWDAPVGYEVQLHSEELYSSARQRARDAYAAFIAAERPEYDFVENLMGERTEMYYVPQMSPLPAAVGVEAWAADRACELVGRDDPRPFFGMVSFIGPHPPFAPPIPFNRYYDPDAMSEPVLGRIEIDHQDEQIPWMNYAVYAKDVSPSLARVLKARYYGEITYIDSCIGRILDALEARGDAQNTLICFFSDHGDHLGDHHAWQKESFFEAATRVPFLVSWPGRVPAGIESSQLVGLADVFGIATVASGTPIWRDGHDILGALAGSARPRSTLEGLYGRPGSGRFKLMVRSENWKYIYLANGGHEQLFDVAEDPFELTELHRDRPEVTAALRRRAVKLLGEVALKEALDDDGKALRSFPSHRRPLERIHQFDRSREVRGYAVPRVAVTEGGEQRGSDPHRV